MTNNNIIRSDFFLTPEEYYRKRANIIEELKKCSIDIGYRDDFNCISEDKNNKKEQEKPQGEGHGTSSDQQASGSQS